MLTGWREHRRALLASAGALALVVPLAWMWAASLVPDSYSVMEMGYADLGGGPGSLEHAAASGHAGHAAATGESSSTPMREVASLTGPADGTPDVAVTLVARQEPVELAGGPRVNGFTLNHTSPGPEIRAAQGDLVEVTLVNESVPDGVTLHWHGLDVPNAEDGVAGVTQDAVERGGRHVYRFVADDAGSYWYHSHQVSHEQVRRGLFGALVIDPREPLEADLDVVAAVHSFDGHRTINGRAGETRVEAEPGSRVRVRMVNTDDGPMRTWVAGAAFRVVAVDGVDLVGPTDVEETTVLVTAGGRVDLEVTVPQDRSAVRVGAGGGDTSLVLGPAGGRAPDTDQPTAELDLLSYGEPSPSGIEEDPDRTFELRIGRRPGFLDGRPGLWWTINGRMFPDVPMYVVSEGDVVRMTVENSSGQVHPMHLHGHHALVLSRDGVASTGSPWWVDSLNVKDGESYEIAFVADNPGLWMDHCHNLPHAAEGLVAHLAYEGVTTSYVVGGEARNRPE